MASIYKHRYVFKSIGELQKCFNGDFTKDTSFGISPTGGTSFVLHSTEEINKLKDFKSDNSKEYEIYSEVFLNNDRVDIYNRWFYFTELSRMQEQIAQILRDHQRDERDERIIEELQYIRMQNSTF